MSHAWVMHEAWVLIWCHIRQCAQNISNMSLHHYSILNRLHGIWYHAGGHLTRWLTHSVQSDIPMMRSTQWHISHLCNKTRSMETTLRKQLRVCRSLQIGCQFSSHHSHQMQRRFKYYKPCPTTPKPGLATIQMHMRSPTQLLAN